MLRTSRSHGSFQHHPLADFEEFVATVIATINRALTDIPRASVRLHVCWGSYEGAHDRDVPREDILPIISKANVGALYLPFANPRHVHEARVLRSVGLAEDRLLIAGVIDPLTNLVEHPETAEERREG